MSAPAAQLAGLDLAAYDKILVAFSGGKDSLACVLELLDQGADPAKVELWHHDIDGREGSDLMDWPITRDYCRKVAEALGLPILFSWKVGGFEGEMLRENSRTAPIRWENPDGTIGQVGGTAGKLSTRRRFPQVSADLSVRWCSAYLKIDVMAAAIRNSSRFDGIRTLVVTGERAEESSSRANYATFEAHKAHRVGPRTNRPVDAWRPVHGWSEEKVWDIIRRHKINPHPAYQLGFGRVSCMTCIFASPDQWATVRELAPARFERIAEYETEFGSTIQRKRNVRELADAGTPYEMDEKVAEVAMSDEYTLPAIVDVWTMPKGAFGDKAGPC